MAAVYLPLQRPLGCVLGCGERRELEGMFDN